MTLIEKFVESEIFVILLDLVACLQLMAINEFIFKKTKLYLEDNYSFLYKFVKNKFFSKISKKNYEFLCKVGLVLSFTFLMLEFCYFFLIFRSVNTFIFVFGICIIIPQIMGLIFSLFVIYWFLFFDIFILCVCKFVFTIFLDLIY